MLDRYIGMIETATKYGRLHDVKDLEEVIRTELMEPNTAFLSPESHFESDWKTFKKMMRLTGQKFAHTKQTEVSNGTYGFHMTGGPNRYVDIIKLRTEMLMESGIYGVWKKWENLRRDIQSTQVYETAFVELSFDNSDVHLVFYLWATCVGTALMIFIAELLMRCVRAALVCCNAFRSRWVCYCGKASTTRK